MARIGWALVITAAFLFAIVAAVHAVGAPLVIISGIALLALAVRIYNRWGTPRSVTDHVTGLDAGNAPGHSIIVGNRSVRWWDAAVETEDGTLGRVMHYLLPYRESRIGAYDRAAKQLEDIRRGKRVRPIDWTAGSRGTMGVGQMAAGGPAYDFCTCSEAVAGTRIGDAGVEIVNKGEDTCVCHCVDCANGNHWRRRYLIHQDKVDRQWERDQARRWLGEDGRWARILEEIKARREHAKRDKADEAAWVEAGNDPAGPRYRPERDWNPEDWGDPDLENTDPDD